MVNNIEKLFLESLDWLKKNNIEFPQNRQEFLWLLNLLNERRIKSLLEIGSREGGSFYCFGFSLDIALTMVSIDLENGPWGKIDSHKKLDIVFKALKKRRKNVISVQGNSNDENIISIVANIKPESGYDLLFIDGDHTFSGVSNDWENYHAMVSPEGVIAFHDIAKNIPNQDVKVPQFWETLRSKYNTSECIKEWGIGVIIL